MLDINGRLFIPDTEFDWSYARSSGPGGQNVNKVASKAVLHWQVQGSPSLPPDVKARLLAHQHRRVNTAGELVVSSERFRDQERNRQDCLEKVRQFLIHALTPPRPRKPTRPSRGSKEARLRAKHHRSITKSTRRSNDDD